MNDVKTVQHSEKQFHFQALTTSKALGASARQTIQ